MCVGLMKMQLLQQRDKTSDLVGMKIYRNIPFTRNIDFLIIIPTKYNYFLFLGIHSKHNYNNSGLLLCLLEPILPKLCPLT